MCREPDEAERSARAYVPPHVLKTQVTTKALGGWAGAAPVSMEADLDGLGCNPVYLFQLLVWGREPVILAETKGQSPMKHQVRNVLRGLPEPPSPQPQSLPRSSYLCLPPLHFPEDKRQVMKHLTFRMPGPSRC